MITYNNSGAGVGALIVIENIAQGENIIFSYDSAVTAVGYNFITIA